jgi:hypothetical protein
VKAASLIALIVLTTTSPPTLAAPRSAAARLEFQRHNLWPSTGERRGACPGFIIDHVILLCAGGADTPAHMPWQTVANAKAKDREEQSQCRKASAASRP